MNRIIPVLARILFGGRWLLAPLYFGMLVLLALVVVRFFMDLVHIIALFPTIGDAGAVAGILTLIDLSLTANLVVLVLLSGYENFVARIADTGDEARPVWMGHVDFASLKVKVIGSIVAIAAVELLRSVLDIQEADNRTLLWQTVALLAFAVTGVLLSFTDRIGHDRD